MKRVASILAPIALGFTLSAATAKAAQEAPAAFALIIGSNNSVDRLPLLKYADDDAADYFELFGRLGARSYLLSRFDENTRNLHPDAAAVALNPVRATLNQAVIALAGDIERARARGAETVVYLVYSGHGNIRDSEGYITLEDARLSGSDIADIIGRLPATHVHLIVDACASSSLISSRGPGGERRPLTGFQTAMSLENNGRVGLLLSTSSGKDSQEYAGFQAGVFSYEVRSGLYGAADADGDGRVSYREIAAFVARANEKIRNEGFRPDVFARPPQGSDTLVDLTHSLDERIDIDGAHAAHYLIEDSQGVRILDVHNGPEQTIHLVRPGNGLLYVRRVDDGTEYEVPAASLVVALADLQPGPARVASRGAAQVAYLDTFSLPFDIRVVQGYQGQVSEPEDEVASNGSDRRLRIRHAIGWGVGALSLASVGAGAFFSVRSRSIADSSSASDPQATVARHNADIHTSNTGAVISYLAGGTTLVASAVLLLWPSPPRVQAVLAPSGAYLGYVGAF